jgi:hypothetical protein
MFSNTEENLKRRYLKDYAENSQRKTYQVRCRRWKKSKGQT